MWRTWNWATADNVAFQMALICAKKGDSMKICATQTAVNESFNWTVLSGLNSVNIKEKEY